MHDGRAVLFAVAELLVDFVACPCSSRTKRHDNLFVYDDDNDDDDDFWCGAVAQTWRVNTFSPACHFDPVKLG